MVELFADLPPGHEFFEQFSFIGADELPEYRALLGRVGKAGYDAASRDDRALLIALAFPYVEARHRLGVIGPEVEAKVLAARAALAENLRSEEHTSELQSIMRISYPVIYIEKKIRPYEQPHRTK